MLRLRYNRLMMTVLAALLLVGCTAVTDGYEEELVPEVSHSYVNLTIAVANNGAITRGTPLGGEEGNGREAGFDRENAVTGITLMLYQDATGINTTANPVIDFVAFYPVSRTTKDADARIEATYETGDQLVPHNAIDFTKPYRAIVVANADLTGSITAGTSRLNNLRNMTLDKIYSGDETKAAASCAHFVMSSEQDQTLTFAGKSTRDAAGDYYYNLTDQPLVIERMAARIDFWAVGGTYDDGTANSSKAGYVYDVTGGDQFVVTAIMPFNLTNKHTAADPADAYGNEYLLKHLTSDLSDATADRLLIDETTTNYVLDPKTRQKGTGVHRLLTNPLETVSALSAEAFAASNYCKQISDMHTAVAASGTTSGFTTLTDMAKSGEDVIVAYPMENTLLPESPLYYNATGIALEGWYYEGGITHDTNPQRYVYYGYLRHQGEGSSYDITTTNSTEALSDQVTAMNIGIVRNNIYRVMIGNIDSKRNMTLRIVVKQWDTFTHKVIYM